MAKSTFVYETYIRTTPEALWHALTDTEFMKQYWYVTACESDFKTGSPWRMVAKDGTVYDTGEILESDPPRKLVIRWQHELVPEYKAEGPSICTMTLEPFEATVKLTITHTIDRDNSQLIKALSGGWPSILSNLKSFMETGSTILLDPDAAKPAH